MKKTLLVWIIVIVAVVLIAGYLFSFYNTLVQKDQAIKGQWAQVENQFQRRLDLIPNLVNSVKGAMTQEQKIFSDIADARTRYSGAQTTEDKVNAANQIESSLSRLLVIMENYPQLKSIDTVQQLMAQLEGTENRVAVERGRFNDFTRDYNVVVKQFPGNIISSMFGFSEKSYFKAAAGAENAPAVNF